MIRVEFLMTIASSTGIQKAEIVGDGQLTVLQALEKLEKQENKAVVSKIMKPEQSGFKPGVLAFVGQDDELKPATPQTVLCDGALLKITTIVGGG